LLRGLLKIACRVEDRLMAWKNAFQIARLMDDATNKEKFADLFALRQLHRMSLPTLRYRPPKGFESAVQLTESALELTKEIEQSVPDATPSEIRFAFFMKFFHHDILVNIDLTELETIESMLCSAIRGKQIRYPWVYGLTLYNRFFELFPIETDTLSPKDTDSLLDGTESGVYQIRKYLVGPLGLLKLGHTRYNPPILEPALWHCSDLVCNAFHTVNLEKHPSAIDRISELLAASLRKEHGRASEWNKFFAQEVSGRPFYYDHLNSGQLHWLIGNAFDESEKMAIVTMALTQHRSEIEQVLPKIKKCQSLFTGSAAEVARKLSSAERVQTILILPDNQLVRLVEELIDSGTICIPPTEIRSPVVATRPRSWLRTRAECSQFGVRFVPTHPAAALLRLRMLIQSVYSEPADKRMLQFKLRNIEGSGVGEKLDKYLSAENPQTVVNEYLFQSEDHLARTIDFLKYGAFIPTQSASDEARLVTKILWKLGFDVRDYPGYQSIFWERHQKLLDAARTNAPFTEHTREAIRGMAANFYVSLEEVLDFSLSFISWALLSDHFGDTHFVCSFDSARTHMVSRLGNRPLPSGEPIVLQPTRNSLFPLIEGFAILASLCRELRDNRDELRRPGDEVPEFANTVGLFDFPFEHTSLLLDLAESDQLRIIEQLDSVTRDLNAAAVGDIRNRITHKTMVFPDQNEIEEAFGAISRVVLSLEDSGVCPIIFRLTESTADFYARERTTLRDYRNRMMEVLEPSRYDPCQLPDPSRPLIFIPWARIGDSTEIARFRFKEDSQFSRMWDSFPKRRIRQATDMREETIEDQLPGNL
jgi:hypothetical protein